MAPPGDLGNANLYVYAANDPINFADPTGLFFTFVGSLWGSSVQFLQRNTSLGASLTVMDRASTIADAIRLVGQLATGTVDPSLVAGLISSAVPFGSFLNRARLIGSSTLGRLGGATDELRGAFSALLAHAPSATKAAQQLGDLGAIAVARKLGFEAVENFPTRYHGIDGLFRNGDKLIIVEAKGGAGALRPPQMSQRWIRDKIAALQKSDPQFGKIIESALDQGNLQAAVVRTRTEGANAFSPEFVLKAWHEIEPGRF